MRSTLYVAVLVLLLSAFSTEASSRAFAQAACDCMCKAAAAAIVSDLEKALDEHPQRGERLVVEQLTTSNLGRSEMGRRISAELQRLLSNVDEPTFILQGGPRDPGNDYTDTSAKELAEWVIVGSYGLTASTLHVQGGLKRARQKGDAVSTSLTRGFDRVIEREKACPTALPPSKPTTPASGSAPAQHSSAWTSPTVLIGLGVLGVGGISGVALIAGSKSIDETADGKSDPKRQIGVLCLGLAGAGLLVAVVGGMAVALSSAHERRAATSPRSSDRQDAVVALSVGPGSVMLSGRF